MQNSNEKTAGTPLWSGRFEEGLHPALVEFNQSIQVDRRLWRADLQGTLAHARQLQQLNILTGEDFSALENCIENWLEKNTIPALEGNAWRDFEDIHSLIESELCREIGIAGKRVHTGRSRNDQVATAFRLTLRSELDATLAEVRALQAVLLTIATDHPDVILPGYTHLQRAQPILFAHYCLAYIEMLERDLSRAKDLRPRLSQLPLGSAALAGSPYLIDREAVAAELGFQGVCENSLDAVSDRDFCLEIASFASIGMVHLSRLAEDLILYSSQEFGFIQLSDRVSTGSSLMPQKKNPDVPELVRGKAGVAQGALQSLLSMMKGTPLAYNKDYQEDKEATFRALDTFRSCVRAMEIFLSHITLNPERMLKAASTGHLNATDFADYLVSLGIPFREAHEIAARAVRQALSKGCEIQDLDLSELKALHPGIEEGYRAALTPRASVDRKGSRGSTHPDLVAIRLSHWQGILDRRT